MQQISGVSHSYNSDMTDSIIASDSKIYSYNSRLRNHCRIKFNSWTSNKIFGKYYPDMFTINVKTGFYFRVPIQIILRTNLTNFYTLSVKPRMDRLHHLLNDKPSALKKSVFWVWLRIESRGDFPFGYLGIMESALRCNYPHNHWDQKCL